MRFGCQWAFWVEGAPVSKGCVRASRAVSNGKARSSNADSLPMVPGVEPSSVDAVSLFFSSLFINFCAWLRICTAVLVPTCSASPTKWHL